MNYLNIPTIICLRTFSLCLLFITPTYGEYLPLEIGNRWEYASGHFVDVIITKEGDVFYNFPVNTGDILDPETFSYIDTSFAYGDPNIAERRHEFVIRPNTEFSLEVESIELIDDKRYYRMSTGNLLRYGKEGRLLEYVGGETESVAIDIPHVLGNAGQVAPWGWSPLFDNFISWLGFPSSSIPRSPVSTAIGTFTDAIRLESFGSLSFCGVTLVNNIGIVGAGCGDDVYSGSTVLLGAVLNGEPVGVTAVMETSWGTIKKKVGFKAIERR